MSQDVSVFDAAVRAHDETLRARGLEVWIGAEPTFTRRSSESPEWLSEALGETKEHYAQRIVQRLHVHYPGTLTRTGRAGVWASTDVAMGCPWPMRCRSIRWVRPPPAKRTRCTISGSG